MTDRLVLANVKDVESATILINTALSDAIDCGGMTPTAIIMPAIWTAANLTFQNSVDDGTTYNDVYDIDGTEFTLTADASRFILLDVSKWFTIRHLKIRSGTSATPVNQVAERVIQVLLRDV